MRRGTRMRETPHEITAEGNPVMLHTIEGAPQRVVALKAVGKVTASDYEDILQPALNEAIATDGKIRLVYELGPEFEGYTSGAAWEDVKLGVRDRSGWERCAVVTDHAVIGDAMRAFGVLMPGAFKVFPVRELDKALQWAAA